MGGFVGEFHGVLDLVSEKRGLSADKIAEVVEETSHIHMWSWLNGLLTNMAVVGSARQRGEMRSIIPATTQDRTACIHPLIAIVVNDRRTLADSHMKRNLEKVAVVESAADTQIAIQTVDRMTNQVNGSNDRMAKQRCVLGFD
jgi:hypothetical protein